MSHFVILIRFKSGQTRCKIGQKCFWFYKNVWDDVNRASKLWDIGRKRLNVGQCNYARLYKEGAWSIHEKMCEIEQI